MIDENILDSGGRDIFGDDLIRILSIISVDIKIVKEDLSVVKASQSSIEMELALMKEKVVALAESQICGLDVKETLSDLRDNLHRAEVTIENQRFEFKQLEGRIPEAANAILEVESALGNRLFSRLESNTKSVTDKISILERGQSAMGNRLHSLENNWKSVTDKNAMIEKGQLDGANALAEANRQIQGLNEQFSRLQNSTHGNVARMEMQVIGMVARIETSVRETRDKHTEEALAVQQQLLELEGKVAAVEQAKGIRSVSSTDRGSLDVADSSDSATETKYESPPVPPGFENMKPPAAPLESNLNKNAASAVGAIKTYAAVVSASNTTSSVVSAMVTDTSTIGVSSTDASVVDAINTTSSVVEVVASKGRETVVDATDKPTGKNIEEIPEYSAEVSNSGEIRYNYLLNFCKEHPYITQHRPSPQFTLSVQDALNHRLTRMEANDTSDLYRLAKHYWETYRKGDADIMEILRQFCEEHPEIISSGGKYDSSFNWTLAMRNTLGVMLSGISDKGRGTDVNLYSTAEKFYRSMPYKRMLMQDKGTGSQVLLY